MSWYALDQMAWERTRELEAADRRSQPARKALPAERPASIGKRAYPLLVVTGDLRQDFGRVLAEPRGRTPDRKRSLI